MNIAAIVISLGVISLGTGLLVKPILNALKDQLNSLNEKAKAERAKIQNQMLKDLLTGLIRTAQRELNSASGAEKMAWVIKRAQELTPDYIISDENVKALIEGVYHTIRLELNEHQV